MGACLYKIAPGEYAQSKMIESALQAEMEAERRAIKCLLLGAGECGKSTILKQMKIIHLKGFTPQEKEAYKALIYKNTVESIQSLCSACGQLQIPFDTPENKRRANAVMSIGLTSPPTLDIRDDIITLWADSGVRRAYERSNEFHLLDSASYFLSDVDRLFTPDYIPNEQDILRSRIATTGIIQTDFKIDGWLFKMFDVGGQRGERKKWIHSFDNVTAIFFIAALSEYDLVLAEDRTKNRLKESLDLFEGIVNLPWFQKIPIILFLNKEDIFREKIAHVDIGIYFPTYNGGCNYDNGIAFIKEEYFVRNKKENTIYCHVTNATNTDNVKFVWEAARHIILQKNLEQSGLLA